MLDILTVPASCFLRNLSAVLTAGDKPTFSTPASPLTHFGGPGAPGEWHVG